MNFCRGGASNKGVSKLHMRSLTKSVLVLLMTILDMADYTALSELSNARIAMLLRWIKLCSCDSAVALVKIIKIMSEKRKKFRVLKGYLELRNAPFFLTWVRNQTDRFLELLFQHISYETWAAVLITHYIWSRGFARLIVLHQWRFVHLAPSGRTWRASPRSNFERLIQYR